MIQSGANKAMSQPPGGDQEVLGSLEGNCRVVNL